jgi:hypothetical protein
MSQNQSSILVLYFWILFELDRKFQFTSRGQFWLLARKTHKTEKRCFLQLELQKVHFWAHARVYERRRSLSFTLLNSARTTYSQSEIYSQKATCPLARSQVLRKFQFQTA